MQAEKPKVLIVDDEKEYLTDFQVFFSRRFSLLTASSGREALKLIAKNAVAIVVSDQRMPRMSGIELLTEIAEKDPQIYRILLTGYADVAGVDKALQSGIINRYLTKDQSLKEIEFAIQEGLGNNPHGLHRRSR